MTTNSAGVPLRKIDELRTLYKLKSHFRDVIVEGRDDAALLRWFLKENDIPNVKVFAVDDRVEVPRETVELYHPEVNVRGRVIALASKAVDWNLTTPSLTCVADSDFDDLDETERSVPGLLMTDFAAMDVYSLSPRPLSKFLVSFAKSDVEAVDAVSVLKPVWAVIYALRYVLHRHAEGLKLVDDFASACIKNPRKIVLDAATLVKMIKPTPAKAELERLLDLHATYLKAIPDRELAGIRGHDAAPALIKFLGLKNDLARTSHVEQLLRSSLELRDLQEQPLFSKLLVRLSP